MGGNRAWKQAGTDRRKEREDRGSSVWLTEGVQGLNLSCLSSHVLAQTRVENHRQKGCKREGRKGPFIFPLSFWHGLNAVLIWEFFLLPFPFSQTCVGIFYGHTAASQENRHGVGLLAWLARGQKEEGHYSSSYPFLLFNTLMVARWRKSVCGCLGAL